jgi:nitrogen regulatory protein P-II 1
MKKIEAIFRPERFDEVKQALTSLGVGAITVSDVCGGTLGQSLRLSYRCQSYEVDVLPRVKIEVVVAAREADGVIRAVIEAARTGERDDGHVFVSEVSEAIRICNNQMDEAAV